MIWSVVKWNRRPQDMGSTFAVVMKEAWILVAALMPTLNVLCHTLFWCLPWMCFFILYGFLIEVAHLDTIVMLLHQSMYDIAHSPHRYMHFVAITTSMCLNISHPFPGLLIVNFTPSSIRWNPYGMYVYIS